MRCGGGLLIWVLLREHDEEATAEDEELCLLA